MHERTVRVTIDSGTIEGFTRDGVHRWRSVPYARPPVGPWRYRAPQPVQPWRGVLRGGCLADLGLPGCGKRLLLWRRSTCR